MGQVRYIAIRRARFNAIGGPVNLPYGTAVEAAGGFLERDGMRLCAVVSETAHKYFARDSDGSGLERGRLTSSIIAAVSRQGKAHETRWAKLWADPLACRYRREDHVDFWVWSHGFFEAPIEDLRHIAALIGV